MGDIGSTYALMRVFGYVISDSGRYSLIGYLDIQIPDEITNCNKQEVPVKQTWQMMKINVKCTSKFLNRHQINIVVNCWTTTQRDLA